MEDKQTSPGQYPCEDLPRRVTLQRRKQLLEMANQIAARIEDSVPDKYEQRIVRQSLYLLMDW